MAEDIEIHHIDEEYIQAIARLIITAVIGIFVYYLTSYNQETDYSALLLSLAYFIFAAGWAFSIKKNPGAFPVRRYLSILADTSATLLAIYYLNEWGGAIYATLLWVILGNGMRFGQQYLKFSLLLGATGFTAILVYTPYWQDKFALGLGLLIGLIILPLFYSTLTARLHKLNERLALELDRSTFDATHDGMTFLLNRTYFVKRLEQEIHRAKRYGTSFCLFYIDLDNFKTINDTYGHLQGDKVIIEIAERIKATIRVTDFAARMGGDEFTILLLSIEKRSDVERFCQKIIDRVSQPIQLGEIEFIPSASIGVSLYPYGGDTVSDIIFNADKAMYVSKSKGKNTFTISDTFAEPEDV